MSKVVITFSLLSIVITLLFIRIANKEDVRSSALSPDGLAVLLNGEPFQPIPTLSEIHLSEPVRKLLQQDGRMHNYSSLSAEIHNLNFELSHADIFVLVGMLAWPNEHFPNGMRAMEINAIKNDVLDKLLRQEVLPLGVGRAMAKMAADPNQDVVWRDYCVQFMDPLYDRLATESMGGSGDVESADALDGSTRAIDEKQIVQDALLKALDERDSTLAGTALIGLENLSRTHDEFDREMITVTALEILVDESASVASRMTALRLSAEFVDTDGESVSETARLLAQTGDTVLLRSAAIVTLGEVGTETDRELLESYLVDEDRQIVAAAKTALDKLDSDALDSL